MGWTGFNPAHSMGSSVNGNNGIYVPLSSINWATDLLPGDILIKAGKHTAFFVRYRGRWRLRRLRRRLVHHHPRGR